MPLPPVVPEMIPLSPEWLQNYRQTAIDTFRQTFDQHNTAENMQAYIDKALSAEILEQDLDRSRSLVFLARSEGQTVGYLKLNLPAAFTHPVEKTSLEVERIYVASRWQGRKIGNALMQKAFSEAKKRNLGFVWLGVWDQNSSAIAFYKKAGFTVFGSHAFLLGDDNQTDLLMRSDFLPGAETRP